MEELPKKYVRIYLGILKYLNGVPKHVNTALFV